MLTSESWEVNEEQERQTNEDLKYKVNRSCTEIHNDNE